jgi:hypothetical protein
MGRCHALLSWWGRVRAAGKNYKNRRCKQKNKKIFFLFLRGDSDHCSCHVSIRQHTSAYVSIRQHTSDMFYFFLCVYIYMYILIYRYSRRLIFKFTHIYDVHSSSTSVPTASLSSPNPHTIHPLIHHLF